MSKARGTDEAKVIQVIETKSLRGEGNGIDPCRIITQYWDFDGRLLAENDPGMEDAETNSAYKKVLGHLLQKYPNQTIELCCKEECADDLQTVLADLGISDIILDKFRY